MFKSLEFISEPYEVLRTVGFRFSGLNGKKEHAFFDMRLDVVKYAGALSLAPLLWEVNPLSGWLQPCAVKLPLELVRATAEETIAATLEYLNGKGATPEATPNPTPA